MSIHRKEMNFEYLTKQQLRIKKGIGENM